MCAGQKIVDFCPMIASLQCPLPGVSYVASTAGYPSVQNKLAAALSNSLLADDRRMLVDTLMHRLIWVLLHLFVNTPRRERRKQIAEMLDQGVITPSHSPWASLIALMKKKDGTFQFHIDYRRPNSDTIRDALTLLRVDDLLEALNGSSIFSTLDLRQGQIRMHTDNEERTAFVTKDGLYEFDRRPFGLSGAPASFDRAIETILSGIQYDICLCHFDDFILPSTTIKEHC